MTIARTIEIARQHLRRGDARAYLAIMSSAIRAANSARAAAAYRRAMDEDGQADA